DLDMALRHARMFGRLHQPDREGAAYLAVIADHPGAFQPRWWRASWCFQQGRIDESVGAFRDMVRLAPDFLPGCLILGGLHDQRGDYAAANDTLRVAIAIRPTDGAFGNLGTAYFNSGRYAEAVDAYNQAFQFGNADYVAWINLGDAYSWLRGRQSDAAKA